MATKQYSIAEARDQLPAIVHAAERGKTVELTRRGKPVAVLISTKDYERLTRPRPSFWAAVQEFRRTHDLGDIGDEDVFADVRDRSPGREFKW